MRVQCPICEEYVTLPENYLTMPEHFFEKRFAPQWKGKWIAQDTPKGIHIRCIASGGVLFL